MAKLTDFPRELLVEVFCHLGSIDDVHHLARSCKFLSTVIQKQAVYVDIMRTVILNSPSHRFDIQLCSLLAFHRDIVQHFEHGGQALTPTRSNDGGWKSARRDPWEHRLERTLIHHQHFVGGSSDPDTSLSDAVVYEILARWQGLKVFQKIWLARELEQEDYLGFGDFTDAMDLVNSYDNLLTRAREAQNSTFPSRVQDHTTWYSSFNGDQVGRFHVAITRLWVINEVRWVLAQFLYPSDTFGTLTHIVADFKTTLDERIETPLVDQLDVYAMYQFLYHHLLPLHAQALADQRSTRLPLTFSSRRIQGPSHAAKYMHLFLLAGQAYLQPPDLIDLAVRSQASHQPPYPSPTPPRSTFTYLRPSQSHRFPHISLHTATPLNNPHPESSLLLTHINIIQRASPSRTLNTSPRLLINVPARHPHAAKLWKVEDEMQSWLQERCLVEFDLYAKKKRADRDIRQVWEFNWMGEEGVRWEVWWWAGGEGKARAKMERWLDLDYH